MASYAFLDTNNVVIEVIKGVDEHDLIEGESPEVWYGKFRNLRCLRTSFNTFYNIHNENGEPFRKNYAGVGFTYDDVLDAFIPPKTFNSWILDETTCSWMAPIPYPEDGKDYDWDEETLNWILLSS